MKALVTGANGQLGKSLQKLLQSGIFLDSKELEISDQNAVSNYDLTGIDVIINAAAYTAVDAAEENEQIARAVNVDGPKNLATLANKYDIPIAHISSDYVFDGKQEAHSEDEEMRPLSVYGQTKADGDEAVMANHDKYYILRSSWVVGDGNNFVRTMLKLGESHDKLDIVDDQIGRLTFTDDLAQAIIYLLENSVNYGIYNATNEGEPASWADIAKNIFEIAGMETAVNLISTAQFAEGKTPFADRPHFSTLDTTKLKSIGFSLPNWQDSLKKYITEQNL